MAQEQRLPLGFYVLPLLWGGNFVAVKYMFTDIPAPASLWLRQALMIPLMLWLARRMGADLKIERRDWPRLFIGGSITWAVYMPVFLEGMARTQPAVGAIAISTSPVFIALLAVLLRQDTFRWTLAGGSAMSLLGVALVEFGGGQDLEGTTGALLVLLSAVIWAIGVVVTRPLYDRYKSVTITAWSLAVSFIPVQAYGLASMGQTDWLAVGWASWAAFVYFWLAAGIAGFAIYFSVISAIGAARAGLMQYMIPAVAAALGWMVMNQPLSPVRILGIGIVLLGVWIGVRRPGPSPVARRAPPEGG